jgi:hypothetical protein
MKPILNNSIFRWVAVLPRAVVSALLVMFPWHDLKELENIADIDRIINSKKAKGLIA